MSFFERIKERFSIFIADKIVWVVVIIVIVGFGSLMDFDYKQVIESIGIKLPWINKDENEYTPVDDNNTDDKEILENPNATLTEEEIKQKYLSNMISEEDINIVTEYTIRWIAISDTSLDKKIEIEQSIKDIQNYYLDQRDDYFIDSRVELTPKGTKQQIILEEGTNINLNDLIDRLDDYTTRIKIANSKVFDGKDDKLPYVEVSNQCIENELDQINELYNDGEIGLSKFRAYRLCEFILEDEAKVHYYRYIQENEDLLKDEFNIILGSPDEGYSLNENLEEVENYKYGYISEIIKTAIYSDDNTVQYTINEGISNEYDDCKFSWNVSLADDNKFIVTYNGKSSSTNYFFGIYEYDSDNNEIQTIFQLGNWNDQLKEKYKDHSVISGLE